jgi:hypothetical protein
MGPCVRRDDGAGSCNRFTQPLRARGRIGRFRRLLDRAGKRLSRLAFNRKMRCLAWSIAKSKPALP